jgi:peroxiredoxin
MHDRRILALALAAVVLACAAPTEAGAAVGEAAPTFTLTSVTGDQVSLADYAGKTVVLEWVNPNCPYSARHAREKTMIHLAAKYGPENVVWLGINSTNPKSGDYLTPEQHQAYDQKMGITYPVLYDPTGQVGHAYGARTTPDMYIVDASGTLVYDGAIDDDRSGREEPAARTNYVDLGLTAIEQGGKPDPSTTRPYGCSVKY